VSKNRQSEESGKSLGLKDGGSFNIELVNRVGEKGIIYVRLIS